VVFKFGLFLKLYIKSIFAYHKVNARFSRGHILFLIFFPPFFILLELIHRFCFLLDALFFSDFRKVVVKSPVFIVGYPRSGTTHLHRLMTRDDRFTSLRLWEILFAPSIVQKKAFLLLGRFDRRMGSPLYRKACAWEEKMFAEARKMHPISHFEAEEDEIILIHIFSSAFQSFLFPFEEMRRFAHFDTALTRSEKQGIMRFYKNCIRRHLYVFGPEKYYVSKNPAFSSKIDSLYETFPDAKIICMVRNPLEAVPSAISWMTHNFQQFHDMKDRYETERILGWISHWYTYPVARLKNYPESVRVIAPYEELAADPKGLVTKIYGHFGFEIPPVFAPVLDEAQQRAAGYQSAHQYTLERMGLTRERIFSKFNKTFDEFGFSRKMAS